jgi:hypothetical protein
MNGDLRCATENCSCSFYVVWLSITVATKHVVVILVVCNLAFWIYIMINNSKQDSKRDKYQKASETPLQG